MKEVILHIGMHKTGSSSIQASLENYSDDTTTYARFEETNHSMALSTIFSETRYDYHLWKIVGLSKDEIDDKKRHYLEVLEKDLVDPKFERLIISGEGISMLLWEEKRSLLRFFKSRGIRVKVVCFVRAPNDFATSAIQERIKGGALKTLPYMDPVYRQRLLYFSKNLPKESLIVKDFADVVSEYGDVVTGFAAICGLDSERIDRKRVNESLSATATKLVYRLNKLPITIFGNHDRVMARQKLINILSMAFPTSGDDKLDAGVLCGLLSPTVDDDAKFLLDSFHVDFTQVSHASNLDSCEKYLSDLSDITPKLLFDALKKQQVRLPRCNTIDEILTKLYQECLQERSNVSKLESSVTHLRNLALKTGEQGWLFRSGKHVWKFWHRR
ncbi:hypothetical protein AB9F26_06970 [Falsihalocynthiibacter sp. BN13B15]|uniref:hypothetical protein n=1 Tax=Falsihalocynthiibacter sp. BN13B15 TaxID=3240871 RepID=UPI0035101F1B